MRPGGGRAVDGPGGTVACGGAGVRRIAGMGALWGCSRGRRRCTRRHTRTVLRAGGAGAAGCRRADHAGGRRLTGSPGWWPFGPGRPSARPGPSDRRRRSSAVSRFRSPGAGAPPWPALQRVHEVAQQSRDGGRREHRLSGVGAAGVGHGPQRLRRLFRVLGGGDLSEGGDEGLRAACADSTPTVMHRSEPSGSETGAIVRPRSKARAEDHSVTGTARGGQAVGRQFHEGRHGLAAAVAGLLERPGGRHRGDGAEHVQAEPDQTLRAE